MATAMTMTPGTLDRTSCLVCDSFNPPDAMLCRQCRAPTALGRGSADEDGPRILTLLGDSNVGKTVYLGVLLDLLMQRADGFEAVPRGPYAVDLQHTVIGHLSHRMFPPKTPMETDQWNWACYRVQRRDHSSPPADLIMPDMAGESVAAELDAPRTFPVVHRLLAKTSGVLLLMDAALAAHGSTQPDFFGLKVLSYIDSLLDCSQSSRLDVPVSILLCKADHCPECFDDPRSFARANLPRTWNLCESRFETVEFFAASVVGSLGYAARESDGVVTPIPMHVALRGIVEPFEWLLDHI